MDSQALHIKLAGLNIRIETSNQSLSLSIPASFKHFISKSIETSDIQLKIYELSDQNQSESSKVVSRVATAGLELKDELKPDSYLWEVKTHGYGYMISTWSFIGKAFLPVKFHFTPGEKQITVYASVDDGSIHPFGYPAGALLIYLLSSLSGSILIHSSAIEDQGNGYLFTGISGMGKSTMADIWKASGARLIHDDRTMVRRVNDCWHAYSTPVNMDDNSAQTPLKAIFLIEHGSTNRHERIQQFDAFSGVLEHCIQHQYDKKMIDGLIDTLGSMIKSVPVYRLSISKGPEIVDYIRHLIYNELPNNKH